MNYWIVEAQGSRGEWVPATDLFGSVQLFDTAVDALEFRKRLETQIGFDCLRVVKLTGEVKS